MLIFFSQITLFASVFTALWRSRWCEFRASTFEYNTDLPMSFFPFFHEEEEVPHLLFFPRRSCLKNGIFNLSTWNLFSMPPPLMHDWRPSLKTSMQNNGEKQTEDCRVPASAKVAIRPPRNSTSSWNHYKRAQMISGCWCMTWEFVLRFLQAFSAEGSTRIEPDAWERNTYTLLCCCHT